ncbi:hypothetical protein [Rheinheimera hassiensis]|uniref:hypothetical protein n=1 Tax=Rheinheimera hassiensis TaxID=1193627 RepID=UPI001F06B57B|nr:hypothetical protein [Rheinheimera hassiensis]
MQTSKSPKLTMQQTAVALLRLGVTNNVEFRKLCSSGERPIEIPSSPHTYYPDFPGWKALMKMGRELLHSDSVDISTPDYSELKKGTHRLGISSIAEYKKSVSLGRLGPSAPENPEECFGSEFKGWGDLLAPKHRSVMDFEQARSVARFLWPTNSSEWRKFCRSGERPPYLPAMPDREYATEGWSGWEDFLNDPGKV